MRHLALVALLACGKREQAAPAAGSSVPQQPAKTESIALPIATGDPVGTATTFLRYTDGKLVEIDKASIFGDRSKPFHGIDPSGTLTSAANGFMLAGAHEPFPMASPTAVFIDRATSAAEVRAVLGAELRGRCWGFAVADHGKLELLEPNPCPPDARAHSEVNLDLFLTTSGKAAAKLSNSPDITPLATGDALSAYLAEQKATPFFGNRTDLSLAFDTDATITTVVDAIARAYRAGFVSAAWAKTASAELREATR